MSDSYQPSWDVKPSATAYYLEGAAKLMILIGNLLIYGQRVLVYPSGFGLYTSSFYVTPDMGGLDYEDLVLKTKDGVTLRCFLFLQTRKILYPGAFRFDDSLETYDSDEEFRATRPVVIMLHGNAENIGNGAPWGPRYFLDKSRCNVLQLSYRGYGKSRGKPSEKGLRRDAQAALDYVKAHPILSKCPIILHGRSLGGAVAIDLASRNPTSIVGLVVENTFLSIPRLIRQNFGSLRHVALLLCRQKWDSASKIALLPTNIPILMLSGVNDRVVPKEQMRELFEIAAKRGGANQPNLLNVRHIEFEDGTHNNLDFQTEYWPTLCAFVADAVAGDDTLGSIAKPDSVQ